MDQDAHMRRIIDNLSSDLSNLSSETKRKFAPVKEVNNYFLLINDILINQIIIQAFEACLLKLRQINSLKINLYKSKTKNKIKFFLYYETIFKNKNSYV